MVKPKANHKRLFSFQYVFVACLFTSLFPRGRVLHPDTTDTQLTGSGASLHCSLAESHTVTDTHEHETHTRSLSRTLLTAMSSLLTEYVSSSRVPSIDGMPDGYWKPGKPWKRTGGSVSVPRTLHTRSYAQPSEESASVSGVRSPLLGSCAPTSQRRPSCSTAAHERE